MSNNLSERVESYKIMGGGAVRPLACGCAVLWAGSLQEGFRASAGGFGGSTMSNNLSERVESPKIMGGGTVGLSSPAGNVCSGWLCGGVFRGPQQVLFPLFWVPCGGISVRALRFGSRHRVSLPFVG